MLAGDDEGRVTLSSIPAGKGRIVRPDPTLPDFDRWPLVIEVEVPPGGEVRARVP